SGYYLSDLGSHTGTYKNDKKTFDESLESGDEITIGSYVLEFFIGVPKPSQPPKSIASKTQVMPNDEEKSASLTEEKSVENKELKASDISEEKQEEPGLDQSDDPVSLLEKRLKAGQGPVLEVIVAWKERVLGTYHFTEKGVITIGASPESDIVVPALGLDSSSFGLIYFDQVAIVKVTPQMSADFYSDDQKRPLLEVIRQRNLPQVPGGYEFHLAQGEMIRLGLENNTLNIFIRYVQQPPKPLAAPLMDLSSSEATGIISSILIAVVFGIFFLIYQPKLPSEEDLLAEKAKKATVVFRIPKKKLVPLVKKVEKKKRVKVVTKMSSTSAKRKKAPGKAAAVKKTRSRKKSKGLVSARPGGSVKTGKKKGASAKSKKPDVSKLGILGVLSGRGVQKKLNKTFSGSGELIGTAEKATGFAGQIADRQGDDLGTRLKNTGRGGKGSATIGITGVGTKGKGSGVFGYGSGGIGKRSRVSINIGGSEAEITGTIDREAVRRVIRANKRAIQYCYEKGLLKNRNLYGKLVLAWDIEEKGRAVNVRVKRNELGSRLVANCIIKRLKTWKFPDPPPGLVGVVEGYPFVFTEK
ncbi:MAG: hypothetical protein D6797_08020, partial [Bdellovibrio sp.]